MNPIHPMQMLKDKLSLISEIIPPKSKIYYLDYPVHSNIGDLLICKGTEKFFQDNQFTVAARYSALNFPTELAIPEDCIIVLHGGGNFGDLYELHQHFREQIVQRYPSHRIVFLPQTIYFTNKEKQQQTYDLLRKHQDLHIFSRDVQGFKDLQYYLQKNIYLAPDLAHQLWPMIPNQPTTIERLYLLRNDIENKAEPLPKNIGKQLDWELLLTSDQHRKVKELSLKHRTSINNQNIELVQAEWYKLMDDFIHLAITLFSQYETIVTSRLHGHILACLMDKQNVLLDNSYGKNSRYYQTWTHLVTSTTFQQSYV